MSRGGWKGGECVKGEETLQSGWGEKATVINKDIYIQSLYFFSRSSSASGPKKERKLHFHHFYRHNCVNAGQVFHEN